MALEIKITIDAPELAQAINNLASAMMHKQSRLEPTVIAKPEVSEKPAYTIDQIMQAGATLMDNGKAQELITLLRKFGVQAVRELKPEQLNAVADALREMGANI